MSVIDMATRRSGGESDVLAAFHAACPEPTPQQVLEWTTAFPPHAEAIRRLAADLLEIRLLGGDGDDFLPTEAELAEGRATAMSMAGLDASAQWASFADLVDVHGKDIPTLAHRLNIGRDVLVALEEGTMLLPPPSNLVSALASALNVEADAILAACNGSLDRPEMDMAAKMEGPTAIRRLPFADIVKASYMPVSRKKFWLGEA